MRFPTALYFLAPLAAALALWPSLARGSEACAGRLSAGDTGKTVEERILFLRSGQGSICPRSLESAKCDEDFGQMIQALEDASREAREACGRLGGGAASSTGASSFADQRAQLEQARASLDRLRSHFSGTQEKMRDIRQHALRSVVRHLDADPAIQPLEHKARDTVFQAAYPTASVEELRARVLELNVPAHHRDVNTLWVAVNALELEQYSGRQVARLGAGLAEAGRAGDETAGRQQRLGSLNSSGASNPLGDILSSPALPGLLGAAAQMAAASKGGSGASSAPPAQEGNGAKAGSPAAQAAAPSLLPPSKLDEPGQGQEEAKANEIAKEEKKAGDTKGGLPVTYTAGSSGISSEPPRTGGRSAAGAEAARTRVPGGEGSAGGEDTAAAGKEEAGRAPASEARSPSSFADSGGGSGGDSHFSGSGDNGPSTPATDALAAILGEEPGAAEESRATAAAPAEAREATIFEQVRAAYVRGLKDGRLDISRPPPD